MSTRDDRILEKLKELQPSYIKLKNTSYQHAGHIGKMTEVADTGDTHYLLEIASPLFADKNRIERQRMVMDILKEEFASGLHALEIKIK